MKMKTLSRRDYDTLNFSEVLPPERELVAVARSVARDTCRFALSANQSPPDERPGNLREVEAGARRALLVLTAEARKQGLRTEGGENGRHVPPLDAPVALAAWLDELHKLIARLDRTAARLEAEPTEDRVDDVRDELGISSLILR